MRFLVSCVLFLLIILPARAADYGKVTTHKVAAGVYLFTTSPYADAGFCGNSVAIIAEDGVLVFDSAATPETAQIILNEIRQLTDKPVRYLVISHWHWDHWGGNQIYQAAFPGLQIITHMKNRDMMMNVEPRWNERGLKQDLPGFISEFEQQIAAGKASRWPEERIKKAEERLSVDRNFLAQKQSLRKTYPNVTFSDNLTLHMGSREIQVLHARAITPGDTYVYLPKEKILITGDILINPYPYAIGGSYPAEWLATLNRLASLQPAIIIPGHGDAVNGKGLLDTNIVLFQEVLTQVNADKARGMTPKQVAEALDKESGELAARVGIRSADGLDAFKAYFLDVFVKRAYRELDGPLGDLPDGLL